MTNILTLNINSKLVSLETPIIMGIINVTENSFYDGSRLHSIDDILFKIEVFLSHGIDILDIGFMSSRPKSIAIDEKEEIAKLEKTIPQILNRFPELNISIDTYRGRVAEAGILMGVNIINDISAWEIDQYMFETIVKYKKPYILMHMNGTPSSMQNNPEYQNLLSDINYFFSKKINLLKENGVHDIILDLGFGFGKTLEDNFTLLKNISYYKHFNRPILTGISRKSMIQKTINKNADESLIGTAALHFEALRQGSNILRVHDPKEAKEVILLFNQYLNA